MYAIIRTGGKQYKVQPGEVVRVEKLEQNLGSEFDLVDVLMLGGEKTVIGQPLVKNAKVTVVVTKQSRTRKQIVFKKNRRKGYRRFNTHRQLFTELFVKSITSPEGKVAATDIQAPVVDVTAKLEDRLKTRTETRLANRQTKETKAEKVVRKTATKKAAAPKKAKATKKVAKKATTAKKKTAKKTSKKA